MYDYIFSDKLKLKSNLRFADTYLQYDKEVDTASATHDEEVDGIESSSNVSLIYEINKKFTNKITLAKTYIKRIYAATENSGNALQDNYYGDRYSYTSVSYTHLTLPTSDLV